MIQSKKITYIFLFIAVIAALYFLEKYVTENKVTIELPNTSENDSQVVILEAHWLPTSTTGVIVSHNHFTLSYVEAHEQAEWVAYELSKDHLSKNEFDRPYFIEDEKVSTGSADWRNYKNSGYDRGHLCPAGDRRFTYEAYSETFLTSNIAPQNREFNSQVWNCLEQKVRFWAQKYDGLYVITGPVLEKGLPTIGKEKVSVPKSFYKIIYDVRQGEHKVLAFLIPNEPTKKSFYEFVTTVDEVEQLTQLNFFPRLSESEANELESEIDLVAWANY